MKRLLLIIVAIAALLPAVAQPAEETSPWSVRVGYNRSLPGKWKIKDGGSVDMLSGNDGFQIGFAYFQALGSGFYFEPALMLQRLVYHYDNFIISNESGDALAIDPKIKKWDFNIPLHFGYRFTVDRMGIRLFTGPELHWCVRGNLDITDDMTEQMNVNNSLFGDNSLSPQHRLNGAWGVGLGFDYGRFSLMLAGSLGLTSLNRASEEIKYHENSIDLNLAVYF